MSVCRDRKRKVPRGAITLICVSCIQSQTFQKQCQVIISRKNLPRLWPRRTNKGECSTIVVADAPNRISHQSAAVTRRKLAAAKVRSLICMGNGAFMRLLTVSQNDYIFHLLHDYRIASSYAWRRLIM